MKGKRVFIISIVTILIIYVGFRMFNNDKRVINLIRDDYHKEEIQIVEGDNFIKIFPLESRIDGVAWEDENIIKLWGKDLHQSKPRAFYFNLDSKELEFETNTVVNNRYINNLNGEITLIKKIGDNNYIVYVIKGKDQGLLYVKNDGKIIRLSRNIEYNEKIRLKISNNEQKIAFYDADEKNIKVYSFSNNKTVKISQELNNEILKEFENNISFSYDGGYLLISYLNKEEINKSYFSVYGADTGNIYADKILGVNPVWANNNLYIAFIYSGNNINIYKDSFNNVNVAGERVGILNLRTRRIKYTEAMESYKRIVGSPFWSKDDKEIFFTSGQFLKLKNKYMFDKVFSYKITQRMLIDFDEYYFKDIMDNWSIKLNENNILFIISKTSEDKCLIKSVDLRNRNVLTLDDVSYFFTCNIEDCHRVLYKFIDKDNFIYVRNNCVYISDVASSSLKYKSHGNIKYICKCPFKNKLLVISKVEDKLELAIIDI